MTFVRKLWFRIWEIVSYIVMFFMAILFVSMNASLKPLTSDFFTNSGVVILILILVMPLVVRTVCGIVKITNMMLRFYSLFRGRNTN